MSRFQGGMIGSVANATSGTAYTGRANGVFPLPQQIVAKSSSLWAIGQTRPNPPTIGTATVTGATTISVAFIPPVQNGGSAITSYTVTSSGGQTATGSSSPIVVSGLTTGTSYTFTVTATNALGTSDSSGTSNSVTIVTDPYFSSVSLLLNGDGTNGSTTFTDLSSSPKTITNNNSVQISTSVKKYGTGAMYFPYPNSSNSNYLTIPFVSNGPLDNIQGTWTIECWYYRPSSNGPWATPGTYEQLLGSTVDLLCPLYMTSGKPSLWVSPTEVSFTSTALDQDRWYHLAVVCLSNTVKLYIDGVAQATTATCTPKLFSGGSILIGRDYYNNGQTRAYVDDLRITKGVARYTTNFPPGPTAALPTL
jgi:hypothetical protein